MIEGAIREDDFMDHTLGRPFGCPRPNNPLSDTDRSLNHFLDVQRGGRGLTAGPLTLGAPARNWALGTEKRGTGAGQNQFSLPDVRDYQYVSLTASNRDDREKATARMFRALGHVLHLLEDMAQPQHTRNDRHLGCADIDIVNAVVGTRSWYEEYIEARTLRQGFPRDTEIPPPLVLAGYSVVSNRPYEEFFSEAGQRGLADFTSRNFLSARTNFENSCDGLVEPPCEVVAYQPRTQPFVTNTLKGSVSGNVILYTRSTVDRLTGLPLNDIPLTSESVWDQALLQAGKKPKFTLNRFNYDAMADILLPRAVGYAAGFLDRFFRGVTYVSMDDRSFVISAGGEAMEGTFELFHERDGNRSRLASWTLSIEAEGASPSLQVPRLPPEEGAASFCWLIFRGRLGDEPDAIAASPTGCPLEGPKPPSPPLGHWLVYWCGDFFNPHQYKYAMFWIGSVEESFVRIYVTDATPQVTCSRIAILPAGDPPPGDPPPGAFTEHPNRS
jgi:hypothetical protein